MLQGNRRQSDEKSRHSPWIVRHDPRDHARLRLFCLPHAGAGAAIFRGWHHDFPANVDVCAIEPPGRFVRHKEPLIGDMAEFIEALAPAVEPFLDLPFALLGYSLGSVMAFELARYLRRRRELEPTHLIIAAAKAPQLPRRLPPISREPRQQFVRQLEQRYGPFEAAIKGDPDMFEIALGIMRNDLGMLENYRYADEPALRCPTLAVGGAADGSTQPSELEGWREQTSGTFKLAWLPGGHFFLRTSGPELRDLVRRHLEEGSDGPKDRESVS